MTPLRYILLGIVICTLSLLLIAGAHNALGASPSPCGPEKPVIAQLLNKYGEKEAFRAILNGGERLMRGFVNPKSGTWTLIITFNSVACVLAIGTDYETDRILQDPT